MKRYIPFAIIAVILVLAVGAGAFFYRSRHQALAREAAQRSARALALAEDAAKPRPPPSASPTPAPPTIQPLAPLTSPPSALAAAKPAVSSSPALKLGAEPAHIRGSEQAPVVLEEFGDFECLACSRRYPLFKEVEEDYGHRLRMIFRQFPLVAHKQAFTAAYASEAAGRQGRFWEMHDLLYDKRFFWTRTADPRESFNDYAKTLGLDLDRFKKDMESAEVKARITADQERGAALGVTQTPAVFINNREVPFESQTPEGLHTAIDAASNRGKP